MNGSSFFSPIPGTKLYTPSDVTIARDELYRRIKDLDNQAKACKSLPEAVSRSWADFVHAFRIYYVDAITIFNAQDMMAKNQAFANEFPAWQSRIAEFCEVGGPLYKPNGSIDKPKTFIDKITDAINNVAKTGQTVVIIGGIAVIVLIIMTSLNIGKTTEKVLEKV